MRRVCGLGLAAHAGAVRSVVDGHATGAVERPPPRSHPFPLTLDLASGSDAGRYPRAAQAARASDTGRVSARRPAASAEDRGHRPKNRRAHSVPPTPRVKPRPVPTRPREHLPGRLGPGRRPSESEGDEFMRIEKAATAGSILSGIAASVCCIGPLVFSMLGYPSRDPRDGPFLDLRSDHRLGKRRALRLRGQEPTGQLLSRKCRRRQQGSQTGSSAVDTVPGPLPSAGERRAVEFAESTARLS